MAENNKSKKIFKMQLKDELKERSDKEDLGETVKNGEVQDDKIKQSCFSYLCGSKRRGKLIYTFCIYLCYFVHGASNSILGPSLLVLRNNTGVTFQNAAFYLISYHAGKPIGIVCNGLLHRKINSQIMFCICLTGTAVVVGLIPWINQFWQLCAVLLAMGVLQGWKRPVIISDLCYIWGKDVAVPIACSKVVSGCGEILSPLILSLFLPEEADYRSGQNNKEDLMVWSNQSLAMINNYTTSIFRNRSSHYTANETENELPSRSLPVLFFPYTIMMIYCVVSALILVTNYFKNDINTCASISNYDKLANDSVHSNCSKIYFLSAVSVTAFFADGMMKGIMDFQSAFLVKMFNWSQRDAPKMNSLYSGMDLCGRLCCMLALVRFDSAILICLSVCLKLISILCYTLFVVCNMDYLLWLPLASLGFALSNIMPLVLISTHVHMFAVTGIVSSIISLSEVVGTTVNALATSHVMDAYSEISFVYVLIVESLMILLSTIVMQMLSRMIKKKEYASID